MALSSFLKLVELQTKVASLIPFTLGTIYTLFHFEKFNTFNFIIMLISLLSFDMATTVINNYIDYKKAVKKNGYNYENHNAIVRDNLSERIVIFTFLFLFVLALITGIILYLNTNIIILILGGLSFLVGILYSFGPIPISRTPLGEIFSGFFMGFIIVFISIYIHIYNPDIATIALDRELIILKVKIIEIIKIFLVSIPTVNGIANIMLANNICDIKDDIENRRYTLPIYLGKENSLQLFKYIYLFIYIDITILLILKIIPLVSILTLLTILPVYRNIQDFNKEQKKKTTFALSIKNFVLINLIYILTIASGILI